MVSAKVTPLQHELACSVYKRFQEQLLCSIVVFFVHLWPVVCITNLTQVFCSLFCANGVIIDICMSTSVDLVQQQIGELSRLPNATAALHYTCFVGCLPVAILNAPA
jgi:hypothetical protein